MNPCINASLAVIFVSLCLIAPAFPSDGVNIIFIVPDGFSPGSWSAVRYASVGPQGRTNLDNMPHNAYYSAYAADSWINDSAGGITAMMTGHKTERGVLNQDTSAVHKKSHGLNLETSMEYAAQMGYATGIVTNTEVYEATPAGTYAHHHNRKDFTSVAAQLVDGSFTPDLIFGGGREYMRNTNYTDPEEDAKGKREDGRDLVDELALKGYKYIESKNAFDDWNPRQKQKILGLFAYEDMKYEYERSGDKLGEPGLWEMTGKALQYLHNTGKNFFLLVEAGKIDFAGHANEKIPLITEGLAFDKTVGLAQKYAAEHPNTLLIIAADHPTGGGCAIGIEQEPDLIEAYGWGIPIKDDDNDRFPDNIEDLQNIAFGWSSSPPFYLNRNITDYRNHAKGHHTAEDCLMFASGWNASLVDGYMDNTDVYHLIKLALPSPQPVTGKIIDLNQASSKISPPPRGETAFYYNPPAAGKLKIQIRNLKSGKTYLLDKDFTTAKPVKIAWKADIKDLPALFKYEYSFNGKSQGHGTFGLK